MPKSELADDRFSLFATSAFRRVNMAGFRHQKNSGAPSFLSLSTLACWIMLYAAGLLVESVEERLVLAPHTMQRQLGSLQPQQHVSADSAADHTTAESLSLIAVD